jgi:rhodanese-related sulfurtransferase
MKYHSSKVEDRASSKTMTVAELKDKPTQFQLVDVRSASEFAAGHIPGTVSIPLEQLERRVADLSQDSPVVLICKSGMRAQMAQVLLASKIQEVGTLEGGTDAWVKDGLPLVHCQNSRWSLERQVRLGAGMLILASLGLALWVNMAWLGLTAFAGAGLAFAGATDICGIGILLAKMPWNRK